MPRAWAPAVKPSTLTPIAGEHTHRRQPRARWTSASLHPGWELQEPPAASPRLLVLDSAAKLRAQLHSHVSRPPAFPSASRRRAPTEAVGVAPRLRRRNVAGGGAR